MGVNSSVALSLSYADFADRHGFPIMSLSHIITWPTRSLQLSVINNTVHDVVKTLCFQDFRREECKVKKRRLAVNRQEEKIFAREGKIRKRKESGDDFLALETFRPSSAYTVTNCSITHQTKKAPRQCKPPPGRHPEFQVRNHSIRDMPFLIGGPLEQSFSL